MTDPHDGRHEIIIVKRRSQGDHGHHGGAWKIAYADFVTAMMAFFLVMWLINAANEKTRAQVASYFNPIKLTDTSTAKKGLSNPLDRTPALSGEKSKLPDEAKATTEKTEPNKSEVEKVAAKSGESEKMGKFTDEQLFRNPYGILGLLAGQPIHNIGGHSGKGLALAETSQQKLAASEKLVDPFDPAGRPEIIPSNVQSENVLALTESTKQAAAGADTQLPVPIVPAIEAVDPEVTRIAVTTKLENQSQVADMPRKPEIKIERKIELPSDTLPSTGDSSLALQIRDQILVKIEALNADHAPNFDVQSVPEGVLISLTDSVDFDMFSVGSAQPQPQLILLMEQISQIIQTYDGRIVLRGHTDSRQFKSGSNDNWRLSASRAQMAFYMLVRAGLNEKKVERIEGYADHYPKFPDQPELAGNRRIEILLKAKAE
jgi:chemotaxis protein MotB